MRSTRLLRTLVLAACPLVLVACSQRVASTGAARQAPAPAAEGTVSPAADETGLSQPGTARAGAEGSKETTAVDSKGRTAVTVAVERLAKDSGEPAGSLTGVVVATARQGGELWAHVRVRSQRPGHESEQVFLSKPDGGDWLVRTYGTGNGPDDLTSLYGLPRDVAQALFPG